MHYLYQWLCFSSVATISAFVFYLFATLCIILPAMRNYFFEKITLPTPSTNLHIEALDTIRGMAASMVALAHMWNFCTPVFNATQTDWMWFLAVGGNKSVCVFVVLSGFLICRAVKNINTSEHFYRYIQRRFLRIYPVYLFTVLLGFIVGQMTFNIPNVLSNVFMIRSISQAYLSFVDPPSWSLYVEVLFYMVLPFWVTAFRKRIMMASVFSFIILMFVDPLASRELWIWKYFFVGIFSSELADYLKGRISEPVAIGIFIVGLILIILDFKVTQHGAYFDWFNYLGIVPKNLAEYTIGLGIACIFIFIGVVSSSWVAYIMNIRMLKAIGVISYSLYLIHPFFILAIFPKLKFSLVGTQQALIDPIVYAPAWYLPFILFPGCLLWATICFFLVERPFLLLRPGKKSTLIPARSSLSQTEGSLILEMNK